uniref:SFRICE_030263 n=1 Tax=Spodoptera frugiperda TaxID=7108 RepID=A0A2H1WLP2_SPOFR
MLWPVPRDGVASCLKALWEHFGLMTMEQQLRECAFRDPQVIMKKDVLTQCGIARRFTCVSVMVTSVTLQLESQRTHSHS